MIDRLGANEITDISTIHSQHFQSHYQNTDGYSAHNAWNIDHINSHHPNTGSLTQFTSQ